MHAVCLVLYIAYWLFYSVYFWRFLSALHWLISPDPNTIPIFIIHKPIVQALNKVGTAISAPSFVIAIISVAIAICISNLVYVGLRKLVPIVFGEKKAN